jgi:hypothetical protein
MIVYIDFEECPGISREEFRRMVKHLKKNPVFHSSKGRTIYFLIKKEENVNYFVLNLQNILRKDGFLTQLVFSS